MKYSPAFKANAIRKMTGAGSVSVATLSQELRVGESTLWRWKQAAGTVPSMSKESPRKAVQQPQPKRPQDWTAEEKLRAVEQSDALDGAELGAFLREQGLHFAQLVQWRKDTRNAAPAAPGGRKTTSKRTSEQQRILELERELRRKDRALAETTAMLVLKKKLNMLFGDEESDTTGKSDD